MGFSHFGAAWLAMAFTCGPHHLDHGLHTLLLRRPGSGLDLLAVLIGAPAGITWFLLRIEAFTGGRGDRFISGTPRWLSASPTISAIYVTALAAASWSLVRHPHAFSPTMIANGLLVVLYSTIGYFLIRTQLNNHAGLQGWSLSGVSLGVVFPTCAIMHAIYIVYAVSGRYAFDAHLTTIDWLAVPAAAYFLWVVRGLYRDSLVDWNRTSQPRPVLAG
jgi:uncharacterized membrane protein YqjE